MSYIRDAKIQENAWVAPGACVVGNVTIGEKSSVWYHAVLRGDFEGIAVGSRTNIQDGVVMHGSVYPCLIGDGVSIGHAAIIHGCTIGDNTLIGMGSIVMNGAKIGKDCLIGAGSLVTERTEIPDGMLAFGSPARIIRPLTEEEIGRNRKNAAVYLEFMEQHRNKMQELPQGSR